jgi:hypothetical protein
MPSRLSVWILDAHDFDAQVEGRCEQFYPGGRENGVGVREGSNREALE